MIGYFIPIVILILAYNQRRDTGLVYTHEAHFWLGWSFAVLFTLFSIFFEVAFLPGIRLWYDLKHLPPLKTTTVEEDPFEEEDQVIFEDINESFEDEDTSEVTTFFSKHAIPIAI